MPVPISCFGWPQTYYMPMLNPDGYEANRRGNGNNADLNRDFPTVTGGSGGYPRLGLDFDLDRGTHKKTKPNFIPPMRASLFRNSAVLPCSSACHFFKTNCGGMAEHLPRCSVQPESRAYMQFHEEHVIDVRQLRHHF